ncbi:flotillin family protein [Rhizobium dioscoreae]|uniref:Flotillin family protein n=1 Tax=Rhizobium dioscoreae TaxID=2653122 RepID=A0ABQ0YXB4_9HYPH|nr:MULTISPECIES: flotillin domain-containing protein [Rhizobium]GES46583.1 flotillin family protein [Rhizobium dioscoreae]GES47898.1 flotillin family protein [Rhizobium dioscoreae]GLU79634.1 flotillin family protein [Rhizobium sp. NBRC 114257]
MNGLYDLILPAGIGLVLILGIGFVLASLYVRSSRDEAYVRTGLGGQKVVLDGGSVVLPIFHSIARVNLKTLRLEVQRGENDALITKDRMRVDIGAEFYVRVKPDSSSIALAAQTLGNRTNDSEQLRQLIEAKFVDSLRSVAATMSLDALQEQRMDFVKAVQDAVGSDLQSNGLELESVSLTRLDQTDIKHFNANNFFDAHGLAALTRVTEARKKERNEVVRDTEVAIAQKDLEARQQSLAIERTKREAELNQQRDIANKSAATRAETAQQEQAAKRAEEEARIAAEQAIAEREAAAKQARESANIDSTRAVQQRDTEARRDIQIVAQESAIAVANKSREESEAKAKAEAARALAIAAEEKVGTAKAVEIAEREKQIAVIDAQKRAQTQATAVTIAAEAEKQAATDQAEAIKTLATAEADAAIIKAKGILETGKATAESEALLNEARNKLSPAIIEFEITRERIRIVPAALAEAVKPIEKISDIRIFDTGGMLGRNGNGTNSGSGVGLGEGLAGQLLSYQANKPILDRLLKEAGFDGDNAISALLGNLDGKTNATQPVEEEYYDDTEETDKPA